VQNLQILPDGDLGGIEFPGHIRDQDAAVVVQDFNNGAAAFFVEHVSSEHESRQVRSEQLMIALSFYIVCFRLSSAKEATPRH
jgi:hypothetical protein